MTNSLKIFFVFVSVALFSSCCADVSKEKNTMADTKSNLRTPTSVAVNQSMITAKIEEILVDDLGKPVIKSLIIKVDVNPGYPSLATAGKTYNLIPNFVLDDENNIILDSERNKNLSFLAKQNPGYEFKALIFYTSLGDWLIKEVIPN